MPEQLRVAGLLVDVQRKAIKNVHLSVYPPHGRVRLSVPDSMQMSVVRAFVISRLSWIRAQQKKMQAQPRETSREFVTRESHYVWGQRLLLKVIETDASPGVEMTPKQLVLRIRPNATVERKAQMMADWYRLQLREAAEQLIAKWQRRLGVSVSSLYIQSMRTKWGSCNPVSGSIRLNTELAKKPRECLEYIVVHELIHLLEPTHNDRFRRLLTKYMPNWEARRLQLNQLPFKHEDWIY